MSIRVQQREQLVYKLERSAGAYHYRNIRACFKNVSTLFDDAEQKLRVSAQYCALKKKWNLVG